MLLCTDPTWVILVGDGLVDNQLEDYMDIFEEVAEAERRKRLEEGKRTETVAPTIESMVSAEKPKMTPDEAIRRLAQLALENKAVEVRPTTKALSYLIVRRIKAVLWILGASNRQLSNYYKVSIPSIKQAIAKEIDIANTTRFFNPTFKEQIPLEEFTWYANKLEDADPSLIEGMAPEQCAAWLKAQLPKEL